jgi:transposase
MQENLIVGVDVAKATLDIFLKPDQTYLQVENTVAGFKKWCRQLRGLSEGKTVLVVMEHTGRYSHRFEKYLQSQGIGYCKIPALQIKRSLGVTRGKNDKIDAERIAEYGWLRRDILQAQDAVEGPILQLRSLLSYRSKLVRDRSGYVTRLKEMMATGTCAASDFESKSQQQIIQHFSGQIKKVEKEIRLLISSNEAICKTDALLQSIKGVGWIVSAYMISCTHNFTKFANARKFNCYAGLAPFKHESGTSIRGRSRVSHLANKEAKTILSLAAFNAIRYNPELKQYYQQRVAQGKRKMSSVNIVRAKLVSRMFAIVKRQTPYQLHLAA